MNHKFQMYQRVEVQPLYAKDARRLGYVTGQTRSKYGLGYYVQWLDVDPNDQYASQSGWHPETALR